MKSKNSTKLKKYKIELREIVEELVKKSCLLNYYLCQHKLENIYFIFWNSKRAVAT